MLPFCVKQNSVFTRIVVGQNKRFSSSFSISYGKISFVIIIHTFFQENSRYQIWKYQIIHKLKYLFPGFVLLKKRISVCGLMMNVRSSISSHFESSQNWPWTSFGTHLLECKQTRLGLTLKDGKQTFVCTESILDAYQENHSTKINTSAARCLGIR